MDSPSAAPVPTNLLSTYFCWIHASLSALEEVTGQAPPPRRRARRRNYFTACWRLGVALVPPPDAQPHRSG